MARYKGRARGFPGKRTFDPADQNGKCFENSILDTGPVLQINPGLRPNRSPTLRPIPRQGVTEKRRLVPGEYQHEAAPQVKTARHGLQGRTGESMARSVATHLGYDVAGDDRDESFNLQQTVQSRGKVSTVVDQASLGNSNEQNSALNVSHGGLTNGIPHTSYSERFIASEDLEALQSVIFSDSDDELEGGIEDQELVDLMDQVIPESTTSQNTEVVHPKLNWAAAKRYQGSSTRDKAVVLATREQKVVLKESTSPLLASSPMSGYMRTSASKVSPTSLFSPTSSRLPRHLVPFVDSSIPLPVLDRSPIPGLSHHLRVVTHFRMGPAVSHAATASRGVRASETVIELYSRVLKSVRDGVRQTFELGDLFHYNRPPYLTAEWIGWHGLPYFGLDADALLEAGAENRICRAIGRIEKTGPRSWRMCILSIWEASWDDIEAVRQITCV